MGKKSRLVKTKIHEALVACDRAPRIEVQVSKVSPEGMKQVLEQISNLGEVTYMIYRKEFSRRLGISQKELHNELLQFIRGATEDEKSSEGNNQVEIALAACTDVYDTKSGARVVRKLRLADALVEISKLDDMELFAYRRQLSSRLGMDIREFMEVLRKFNQDRATRSSQQTT